MPITAKSKASIVGAGVENVQFQPSVSVVERKVAIIATYDPTFTDVIDNVPVFVFNANDAGSKFGFGSMVHRLAAQVFAGSRGAVKVWIVPQSETGAAATGTITFTGSSGVKAGKLPFYIASLPAQPDLIDGDPGDDVALKLVAAVNDDKTLPVTAGAVGPLVTFTAKSKGPWGNDISLALNLRPGDALPDGVVTAIVDMDGGDGIPDVQDALDGMGVGDNQNQEFFTDIICGYGDDTDTLDKISAYNGTGNDFNGNYKQEVARPFRALIGDTAEGTAGLTALIAFADLRAELDRTNGVIGVPGNYHHPMELAAVTMGVMARISNIRAQETYGKQILPGILPGPSIDRWTDNYDSGLDLAIRSGVSTSQVKNNVVTIHDMVTFYRPEAVDPDSNGYRSMRNTSITQNKLFNIKRNFQNAKWQGITIVEDATIVTDLIDQEKARDTEDVKDDLLILNKLFAGKSWSFSESFFIERLKANPNLVSLRADGRGWDIVFQDIYSGEGGIFNTKIQFDVSLAIFIN